MKHIRYGLGILGFIVAGCQSVPTRNDPVMNSEQKRFSRIGKLWGEEGISWGQWPEKSKSGPYLWYGTLRTLNPFVLERVDRDGGVIQTAWSRFAARKNQVRIRVVIQRPNLDPGSLNISVFERNAQKTVTRNTALEQKLKSLIIQAAQKEKALDSRQR